jgi:hypothetical protein
MYFVGEYFDEVTQFKRSNSSQPRPHFIYFRSAIIDATNPTMNAKKIPIKKDEVPVFLKKVSRGGRTTWWMPPLENFLMHHFLSFSREHVSTSDAVVHITPRPSSNSIEVDCHYSHP